MDASKQRGSIALTKQNIDSQDYIRIKYADYSRVYVRHPTPQREYVLPKGYLELLEQKRYRPSTIKTYRIYFSDFMEYHNLARLFCILFCFGAVNAAMAQSGNNLSALEKQLCFIQDTLSILRQNYPYTDDNSCDSLQHRFSILLEELCAADKEMKYDFIELRKKERQFTMAVSADGDMRVFSRNTYFGGSMPLFASYLQYKDKEHLYFFDINEDNDMGLCYDTIYSIQASDKRYYLLSGTSQIATAYPLAGMKAVSYANGEWKREMIFVSGNQQTDYLSISYRYAEDNIDTRLFINSNLTFPRIVYVETQEEILKPVTVRDKDNIEYIGGEIEVYKLERNKNEIKFISNNESYGLNGNPF